MRKLDTAQECGLRLKRIRDAKNMTQQELAELIHVSPQAISKYEKNGISDINTINDISRALGWDLLTDEQNEEGTVGEVGKEILFKLVENQGFMEVGALISEMYGLDKFRITDEIIKLQRIGMVIREQYEDFYKFKIDGLFITAKGVICTKNILPNRGRDTDYEDMLVETKTYEKLIDKGSSYQEYFENEKFERILRNLPYVGEYRIDFLQYLLSNYLCDYCGKEISQENYEWFEEEGKTFPEKFPLLPGENCYFDIIFRMALEFDNEKLKQVILSYYEGDEWLGGVELEKLGVELGKKEESIVRLARDKFIELSSMIEYLNHPDDEDDNEDDNEDEAEVEETPKEKINISVKEKRYLELKSKEENAFMANMVEDMDHFLGNNPRWMLEESIFPMDWYSIDEVWLFVRENLHAAMNEKEKLFDEQIAELAKIDDDIYDYYEFPKEWEEAGIGDYIRSLYGISK